MRAGILRYTLRGGLMRSITVAVAMCCLVAGAALRYAQTSAGSVPAPQSGEAATSADPIKELVARLDFDKYKATVKGLTQFGDRRQGTDRNRAAVDWIEAQ